MLSSFKSLLDFCSPCQILFSAGKSGPRLLFSHHAPQDVAGLAPALLWRRLHEKRTPFSVLSSQNIFPRLLFPDCFACVLCQNRAIVGASSVIQHIYPSLLSVAIYSILGFSHNLLHGVRSRVGVLFLPLALLNVL